jgi:hypothetical protein
VCFCETRALLKIKEYQNEEESQHVLAGPCANFILCSPNLDNLKALICSCWLSWIDSWINSYTSDRSLRLILFPSITATEWHGGCQNESPLGKPHLFASDWCFRWRTEIACSGTKEPWWLRMHHHTSPFNQRRPFAQRCHIPHLFSFSGTHSTLFLLSKLQNSIFLFKMLDVLKPSWEKSTRRPSDMYTTRNSKAGETYIGSAH